jgi:hypothetical protein
MPTSSALEIAPGFYFDGKKGLRRVLSVERGRVVYERLHPVGMAVVSHEIPLSEFARWAKQSLPQEEAEDKYLTLQAKAVRPSAAQVSGLEAANRSEPVRGKVLTSLIEKSLVHCPKKAGEPPQLTELGRRVFQLMGSANED